MKDNKKDWETMPMGVYAEIIGKFDHIENVTKTEIKYVRERMGDLVTQLKRLNGQVAKNTEWINKNDHIIDDFDEISKIARNNDKKLYGVFLVFTVINVFIGFIGKILEKF